ncbi:MAG TPA: hypothetical protein VFF27_01925 [Bacteroidia bacterium]|jgi:hypothetical protein|nr:hypothetical protein [Bacteroidia bacterium]
MMLQIVWCCFYIALFVFIIRKSAFFRLPEINAPYVILLFLLKIVSAIFVWKLFVAAYPISDADIYFDASKVMYDVFFKNKTIFLKLFFGIGDSPELQLLRTHMQIWNTTSGSFLIVDSRTMIRLNALLRFFSLGYFNVHAIILCFLSFIGLTHLYKLFYPYFRHRSVWLIIACYLFPSLVFWSSAVLKEGILFLGIGLTLYHCQCGLRTNYSYKNSIGLVVGVTLLVLIKMYVLLAMLPALLANFWIANSNHKKIILKYVGAYIFFLFFLLSAHAISPSLDFGKVINKKQTDFGNVAKGGRLFRHDSCFIYLDYRVVEDRLQQVAPHTFKLKDGYRYASFGLGKTDTTYIDSRDTNRFVPFLTLVPSQSTFTIHKIKPNMIDILKNAPMAFVNILIIPSLFELDKAFAGLILVENLILLICLFASFFFLKKDMPLAMVLFCASFVFILFALIGLTTPILGAVVRYRIPGIPFLIILTGLIINEKKIKNTFFKIKENLSKKAS